MLFDKDGFYIAKNDYDYDYDYDFTVNILNSEMNRPFTIYNLDEGFCKGNMFPNLYDEFKQYRPKEPTVSNQREAALLEIQKLDFAVNDLNLYLDLHPEDRYAYSIFKKYTIELKKKKENYSKVYGPLTIGELGEDYEWSSSVWPWEEGRM